MSKVQPSFVEVCIYDVKPAKTEEFERLLERVAEHHRDFPGVRDVRYMKRIHRQGDFSPVKNGDPPIRLTKATGSVTYVLYWEMDSYITHGKATGSGLEHFGLSCRLCPMNNIDGENWCGGCKTESRIAVGCSFITCAVKKKMLEFCWDCEENIACKKWKKHRESGKHHDSFKCYQKLEDERVSV